MRRVDHRNAGTPWRVLLALLCVFLIAIAGVAQVAHTHSDQADTHADCSLCAAAHLSAQPAASPEPAPAIAVVATLEPLPALVFRGALATFALFTRPPPAA